MRVWVLLPLVLLLLAGPAAAEDAYEETEFRLKTAGVDAALRARIHAAIRRGVKRLRTLQKPSGMVGRNLGSMGTTALAALALRHAAIPEAREGARLAGKLLLRHGRREMRDQTYQAGIMSMLLQAEAAQGAALRFLHEIHARLGKGPYRADGYWDYRSAGGQTVSNLSTAQFACLGLWAAERTGAHTATRAWSEHLDALLEAQHVDGSWGYGSPSYYEGRRYGGPRTYPTGTFMGLANLVLAHNAIREQVETDPERHARVLLARAAGEAALRRHAQWLLGAPGLAGPSGRGWPHYALYALEKACIFLDLEDVGGVRWYVEGADWLLGDAESDGARRVASRAAGQPIAPLDVLGDPWRTSFSLLFLLRASESYRPITPRPIDAPKTVTPRSDEAPPPTPQRAAPPLKSAQLTLNRIELALGRKRLTHIRPLLDALRFAARTHGQIRAATAQTDPLYAAWMQRAESLLLRCTTRFRRTSTNDRLLWQAVAVRALDALATTHPRVAPELMRTVLAMEADKAFRAHYQLAWYGTAIETLRRLDPPGLLGWLRDRAVSGDTNQVWRTSAALTALGGQGPSARGRERQGVLRTVLATMQPILRRSRGNAEIDGLLRDLQVLVQRLARPSAPDDFPVLGSLDVDVDLRATLAWWRRHGAPDDPLWAK